MGRCPHSIPSPASWSNHLCLQGARRCKIIHGFQLPNHLVGSSWLHLLRESSWRCHQCHRRGGESGAWSCHSSFPGRTGCGRAHTSSSHPSANLSASLPKPEHFQSRAKQAHLPTHTVLTMKTPIRFHSPIKGMIHVGEWARRITQDERGDAIACPFWGSPPGKQGCVEHMGTQDGVRGGLQEGPGMLLISCGYLKSREPL